MKIRPLHDRVIVKRVDEETTTAGGILLPGKQLDNGTVRALEVKVGDKVLFGKYSGNEVKVDGDDLIVMREEDIMGVLG
jgi:chaperonin GroES